MAFPVPSAGRLVGLERNNVVVIVHRQPDGRLERTEPVTPEEAAEWLPRLIEGMGELLDGDVFFIIGEKKCLPSS